MTRYERKAEVTQLADEWGDYWRGVVVAALIYAAFAVASAWAHHAISLALG